MKEVTLKQIAENLGISVTTVSKALKDYSDVSKKTKQLVKYIHQDQNLVKTTLLILKINFVKNLIPQ